MNLILGKTGFAQPFNQMNVNEVRDMIINGRTLNINVLKQNIPIPQKEVIIQSGEGFGRIDEQSGEGILNIAGAVLKLLPAIARGVSKLAFGSVGTTISNTLSEKFNKNPEWRPGFPGEKHIVLPTSKGLTRTNWAGPGTNIAKRLARGDKGVDGPRGIDVAAKKHDLAYVRSKTAKDIRRADNIFIRDIRNSTQGRKTKFIVTNAMRLKKLSEDFGILKPEDFTSLPALQKGKDAQEQLGEGHLIPGRELKVKILKQLKRKRRKKKKVIKRKNRK